MDGHVYSVRRAALGVFPYTHFGVEVPGGVCENSLPGVRVVSWDAFARGREVRVQNPDASAEELAGAVARALSRVGEHRYSVLGNNCEHFANWCATGVAISQQVLEFLAAFARFLLGLAAGMLAFSVARLAATD